MASSALARPCARRNRWRIRANEITQKRLSERPTAPPEPLERPAWVPADRWPGIAAELARWAPKALTVALALLSGVACTIQPVRHVEVPAPQPRYVEPPAYSYERGPYGYHDHTYWQRDSHGRRDRPRRVECRTTHRVGKGVFTVDVKRCREVRR